MEINVHRTQNFREHKKAGLAFFPVLFIISALYFFRIASNIFLGGSL
jgi:hypothetical protein